MYEEDLSTRRKKKEAGVVLELAGNLLAELLAEISSALLAEIFLLLAEKSRNFEPFLMIFTQILKKYHQKFFFSERK